MLRRLAHLTVAGVAAAAVVVSGTVVAAAAPAFTPTPYGVITGDVTGDGLVDRVTLGHLGDRYDPTCVAQVRAGLGRGALAAPVFVTLPVRGTVSECPDLGTVLSAPTASADRLAVGFFASPPRDADFVQVFSLVGGTARYRSGMSLGQFEPSHIGSQDFDGDGWGDLWETTDQGDGFTSFLARGPSFRPLTSLASDFFVDVQFLDLDHGRGTDILLTTIAGRGGPEAVVVDGRTGAAQTLAAGDLPDGTFVQQYRLSLVDLDHDAYPDLRVDALDRDVLLASQYFTNRSQGGRWYFAPTAAPRA